MLDPSGRVQAQAYSKACKSALIPIPVLVLKAVAKCLALTCHNIVYQQFVHLGQVLRAVSALTAPLATAEYNCF